MAENNASNSLFLDFLSNLLPIVPNLSYNQNAILNHYHKLLTRPLPAQGRVRPLNTLRQPPFALPLKFSIFPRWLKDMPFSVIILLCKYIASFLQ